MDTLVERMKDLAVKQLTNPASMSRLSEVASELQTIVECINKVVSNQKKETKNIKHQDFLELLKKFPSDVISADEFGGWYISISDQINESWTQEMVTAIDCMLTDTKLRTDCIKIAEIKESSRREHLKKYQKPWEVPVWARDGWKPITWKNVYLDHPQRAAIRTVFEENLENLPEELRQVSIVDPVLDDDFLSGVVIKEPGCHSVDGLVAKDIDDFEPRRKIILPPKKNGPFQEEDLSSYTEVYNDRDNSVVVMKERFVEDYVNNGSKSRRQKNKKHKPKQARPIQQAPTKKINVFAQQKIDKQARKLAAQQTNKPVPVQKVNRPSQQSKDIKKMQPGSVFKFGDKTINTDDYDLDSMMAKIKM
jgi:hypothetical protein